MKKILTIVAVVAIVAMASPLLAGQTVQKQMNRQGVVEGQVAPRLIVQRTAIRDDGAQVVQVRFEGTGVAALGAWLGFPVLEPVKVREVTVKSELSGRFQLLNRVESMNGHLQVRLAAMDAQVPFEGIPSGSIATVVLPAAVDFAQAQVVAGKASASNFQAKDINLDVYTMEDDGPSAADLVAQARAFRAKDMPSVRGTTTAPGIDFEIVDPTDGDNGFCVTPGGSFTADVVFRPGTDTSTTCSQSCGTVNGGDGRIATAVFDIAFDTSKLSYASAANVDYADGLIQDNSSSGRIGWAAAGDWATDGDTSSALADPCVMAKLDQEMTLMQVTFNVDASFTGSTTLHFRRSADGFAFSVADACANGWDENDFDEIVDGTVGVSVNIDTAASGLAASDSTIYIQGDASNPKTSAMTTTLSDGTNPLSGQVVRMEFIGPNYSNATITGVTDNGDGTYSATVTSGPNPGRVKVRYYVDKCDGTFSETSEDKVIIINNSTWGCDSGDANGSGALEPADGTAVLLEYLDGDTNGDPTSWESAGSYAAKPCADANGSGALEPADGTAVLLMWLAGM